MPRNKDTSKKVEAVLFIIIGVLALVTLIVSATARNIVETSREKGDYYIVVNACYEVPSESASTDKLVECSFILNGTDGSDSLIFYIAHYNVEVYIDGVLVQKTTKNSKLFSTSGGVWTIVPLKDEDCGKDALIVLEPLYEGYDYGEIDFYIGSEAAICAAVFAEAVPEIMMSICVALIGLLLLGSAIYYSVKSSLPSRLYAISLLAIFSGIWRLSYGRFIYILFREQAVFIYTLSIISLMLIALAMLNCIRVGENEKAKRAVYYGSIIYCVLYSVQLILQLTGLVDLRELLTIVHITLIISAVALFVSGIIDWVKKQPTAGRFFGRNYSWLVGIGIIVDLILYYFSDFSEGMLFTLGAILIFVLMEGIRLLMGAMEQKNALEEMKINLMLSRSQTMMSQIRSHFVFNLLNAISGMCKYDPEMADDTIVRFSRYLRSNIDIMEKDENIPFSVDLKQLEDYVILEQIRFGDKIEFYTDIEVDDFVIPPLILQPIVENSIKHGIAKKEGNGTIILKTRRCGEDIVITVEDDGVGFDMAELDKEKSVGLRNIRFRLEHLVNGTMKLESKIGEGTVVTITLPQGGE